MRLGRLMPGLFRPLRCVIANLSMFADSRKESASSAGTVSSPSADDDCDALNDACFSDFACFS